MSKHNASDRSSAETLLAAKRFTRRAVLKAGAAAGAVTLAGPALVRNALSSSGELNIMFWSDELPDVLLKGFTDKTGIKVNFTGFGSNEELLNKMKATQGEGFDIISPTLNRVLQYAPLGILQPWDMNRVPADRVTKSMLESGMKTWNLDGKGTHWLPHVWGTEGIAWRTDLWKPADGTWPSYGDVWDDANAGKTMGRGHSMMLGAGLFMERTGLMEPGSVWSAYESEEKMRPVWERIAEFCVSKKKNIKLIWNDADAQKNGLITGEVIVGQTWDGPPIALKNEGQPVMYRAPMEGSMAWVDGMSMPKGAKNIDQVYAFVEYDYTPEASGSAVSKHGYNSPVVGAAKFAGEQYAKNFAEAYPEDALDRLNPWPAEAPWYADIRAQYVEKFQAA